MRFVIWYERAMPRCETWSGRNPVMSVPSKRMRPPLGWSTPVRQLKNVDLPAPFGPMTARISPDGTATETSLSAVSPPKRTVRPWVARRGAAPPPRLDGDAAVSLAIVTLGELARDRDDRLFFRDRLQDLVLAAAHLEHELAHEGLVVLLAQELVALREVLALLHLEAFERLDQLHRVLAPLEA